ncbi:MAG TPA: AAA family ATPase [Steroidobacteraceae bacterium]|nr:AAA family ATPase [Steroidobacteraceae bacterium]
MSLVEKALRKLQQSAAHAGALPSAVTRGSAVPARPLEVAQPASPHGDAAIVVDFALLRAAGLLPPEGEEPRLAQQYRRIKRPLIAAAMGRGGARLPNGHLILVASAMPGEGKTFTALNLALSMSLEKDVHVLLVDADVAKPQISRLLGLDRSPGLLDVLRDPSLGIEQVIQLTDVPNLSVLPAGAPGADATELLASARMEQVARTLGEHDRYRIVLFDSPPLLHTTESHILAQVAGQVVVVVRAEFTPQPVLLDALKLLEGRPGVSLVLNQSIQSATTAYYYYGYTERPSAADGKT